MSVKAALISYFYITNWEKMFCSEWWSFRDLSPTLHFLQEMFPAAALICFHWKGSDKKNPLYSTCPASNSRQRQRDIGLTFRNTTRPIQLFQNSFLCIAIADFQSLQLQKFVLFWPQTVWKLIVTPETPELYRHSVLGLVFVKINEQFGENIM